MTEDDRPGAAAWNWVANYAAQFSGSRWRPRGEQVEFVSTVAEALSALATALRNGGTFDLAVLDRALRALQLELGETIWHDFVPLKRAEESVEALAQLMEARYGDTAAYDQTLDLIWDGVLNFPRPATARSAALEAKILALLGEQLSSPNRWMKFSALHGLGHLSSDISREVITQFLRSRSAADQELREWALAALRGDV